MAARAGSRAFHAISYFEALFQVLRQTRLIFRHTTTAQYQIVLFPHHFSDDNAHLVDARLKRQGTMDRPFLELCFNATADPCYDALPALTRTLGAAGLFLWVLKAPHSGSASVSVIMIRTGRTVRLSSCTVLRVNVALRRLMMRPRR